MDDESILFLLALFAIERVLAPIAPHERSDLLELLDDRVGTRSTIITSQIPVDHWYDMIGNATIADAILDRLVHNAYRIELSGESLRKQRTVSMSDTTFA